MSKDKATERQWEIGYTTGCVYQIHEIVNGKRTKLPIITLTGDAKDAALIVRAVNCHERLVEALRAVIEQTGVGPCRFDHHGYCQEHNLAEGKDCWAFKVRALIAEAKGLEIPEEGE